MLRVSWACIQFLSVHLLGKEWKGCPNPIQPKPTKGKSLSQKQFPSLVGHKDKGNQSNDREYLGW